MHCTYIEVRQQWAFSGFPLVILVNFIWRDGGGNDDDDDEKQGANYGFAFASVNLRFHVLSVYFDFHNHCPKPKWLFLTLPQGVFWH